jgi:hypothetical protein
VSATPDYEGLLKLLPRLNRFPDAIGETTLTLEEAEKIRRLGFAADAGPWRVPALPPELTRDTMSETLSAGWKDRTDAPNILRSAGNPERATAGRQFATTPRAPKRTPGRYHLMPAQQYGPVEPVVQEAAQRIEQALRNGPVAKRLLQQRMGRYGYKAPIFHEALRYLSERGKITLHDD